MIDGRRVVALLLLGGIGSRLWPLSTGAHPKPFLKLLGPHSLYQLSLQRLSAAAVDEIVVVTGEPSATIVREQARELGLPQPNLVLEPVPRDTGPAIAAAVATIVRRHGPDTIAIAAPGDHLIPDEAAFAEALAVAVRVAAHDFIVTFGVRPIKASTEYGYIQRGAAVKEHPGTFRVVKFHEKPRQQAAETYIRDGAYDWNSGIFVFGCGLFAREAARHMPLVWDAAGRAVPAASGGDCVRLDATAFAQAPRTSIDYALLERSDRVATIPVTFAWSDIGNWASIYDALARDGRSNATVGDAALKDVSGSLVVADGVRVMVIGMDDVVVVSSPRGTIVAPRARAAEIKGLV